MRTKFKSLIALVLGVALTILLGGCNCKGKTPEKVEHTVIIYIAGNNNLSNFAIQNINALEAAYSDAYNARVLVFYNRLNGYNDIIEICADPENSYNIVSPVLKSYSTDLNPCDPMTLSSVINDCRSLAPAQKYSLVLWSHGTGWLPKDMTPAKSSDTTENIPPVNYTFGDVYSTSDQMEIYDLANALPSDIKFEYIFFDACHMSCVEIAYEIKDNAKYFIGSVAEIPAAGFDYYNGFDDLVQANVVGIGRTFFEYYDNMSGINRTATIGVIDLSMMEKLAQELSKLVANGGTPTSTQQYGRYLGHNADFRNLYWDLANLATNTWGSLAEDFNRVLSQAVVYENSTEYIFNSVKINTHCGLSAYIPRLSQPQTLNIYTQNYGWAQATGLYNLAY